MERFLRTGLIFWVFIALSFSACTLAGAEEQPSKPGQSFKDCAGDCPEVVIVPAGSFTMGSQASSSPRKLTEVPPHQVTIAEPFVVSKFELTFAQWDACAADGGCISQTNDHGWGRQRQPVINVSWNDAQRYMAWLSKITGKGYRLLTEAEYEYAARAGTQTAYPWGDEVGSNHANCEDCGSRWDATQTAPVGSFAPNQFGLYDMVGNAWEWVEDCLHEDYTHAPLDGSAWMTGDCSHHRIRGGSWASVADELRSSNRSRSATDDRLDIISFRVGRNLGPDAKLSRSKGD
jgi:formylglycine-generating enzyme required for sulfatase activity